MKKIAIIGAGNVGKVLGLALQDKGYRVVAAVARSDRSRKSAGEILSCPVYAEPEKATLDADIIFITTPDSSIKEVCDLIADRGGFKKGQVVLHTSGAHSSAILFSAKREGASVLSFHPLQTFPTLEEGLRSLPGTFFTVEGDKGAYPIAEEMIAALGGKMLSILTEMKPIYHAAACVACNYLVSLMDIALKMFELTGIPREKACEALFPLINGTLHNIQKIGTEKALTGPIARGDYPTVSAHVEKLSKKAPELLPLYNYLGLYTVELAVRKGTLTEEGKKKLKTLLGGS